MPNKKVIRCTNHHSQAGNILLAVDNSAVYVKCQDRDCKRWTRITFNIPGVTLNLHEAGIVQEILPEDYHLHLEPATTVAGTQQ